MKKETVGEYEVREATVAECLPLMNNEEVNIGLELCKLCVTKENKPLGDSVMDLGFSTFQQLMAAVNRVNGLGDEGKS